MRARSGKWAGFTLVELLVAVGIIVLLTGLLLPAVMRARRAGRQAVCMNNLREIGRMMLRYADTNSDYIPLGTSVKCNTPPEYRWRTDWNDFIAAGSAPMSALGPLLIDGSIHQGNASLLFCPSDARKYMKVDLKHRLFPAKGEMVAHGTIQISYAIRPEKYIWYWTELCPPAPNVIYPLPMAKLDEFRGKALMAEPPERPPYNHGTDASPAIHVLYQDGSVRLVTVAAWRELKPEPWYVIVDQPQTSPRENSSAMPVWQILDKQ